METTWVGLDIYQPKKVKISQTLQMHTPTWRKIILYITCMQSMPHNWWGAPSIDLTCCETLVACNSYTIYFSSIGTLNVHVQGTLCACSKYTHPIPILVAKRTLKTL